MDPVLIVVTLTVFFLIAASQIKKTTDGKIKDESVNLKIVLEILEDFEISLNPKLKVGYTEKSIQKQLDIYLKSHFEHVVREYGIEGINGTKIDFDIGRGKVGLEIKLADSIFKSAGYQRMLGQLQEYTNAKYNKKNLIVLIAGSNKQKEERAIIAKLKTNIENNNATMLFTQIP